MLNMGFRLLLKACRTLAINGILNRKYYSSPSPYWMNVELYINSPVKNVLQAWYHDHRLWWNPMQLTVAGDALVVCVIGCPSPSMPCPCTRYVLPVWAISCDPPSTGPPNTDPLTRVPPITPVTVFCDPSVWRFADDTDPWADVK